MGLIVVLLQTVCLYILVAFLTFLGSWQRRYNVSGCIFSFIRRASQRAEHLARARSRLSLIRHFSGIISSLITSHHSLILCC